MFEIEATFGGFTVVRREVETQRGYTQTRYHLISDEGEWAYTRNSRYGRLPVLTIAKLANLNDGIDFPADPDLVPIQIAAEGKPCIAAYLSEVHRLRNGDIAEKIGVSEATAKQYVSDYRHSRR